MSHRTPWALAFSLALLLPLGAVAAPASFDIPADLNAHAVLSCQDMTIAGNPLITSEGIGGTAGAVDKAHVRSNGNVTVAGSSEVRGDVVAGPGKQVVVSGTPAIAGQKRVSPAAFDCAPIDLAALQAELRSSNDNQRVPRTDRGNAGLTGGGVTLSARDGLTLPAGTYLLSNLTLTGNSQLRVSGPVRILVTGNVSIAGNSRLNDGGNPFQLRLWTQGSVAIAAQSNVHAYVYAPLAKVSLTGAMNVVGAVHAKSLRISGGVRIRRVTDDAPPQLTLTSPSAGQSVPRCEAAVSGTVSDAEGPMQLTVNSVAVTPAANGSFTTTASLATADPGLVEVLATDTGGNTTRVAVRVSIVPPTVALTSPAPGSLVPARLVDLRGTSGNATTVTVNGGAAVVPGDGTFRRDGFDLGPNEGLATLALVARQCGGEASATVVLDVDTKAPVVAIDSPAAGALFGASPIAVSGIVQDAHLAAVKVKGVTATIAGGRFTAAGVTLTEGATSLIAVATDALGRATTSAAVTVELDSTAPSAAITSPASGSVVSTPALVVTGSASDLHLAGVTVNGVAAAVAGPTFAATVTLVEGDNSLVATARDTAGHSTASPAVVAVLDTRPPVVAITEPAAGAQLGSRSVMVRGTVSDAHLERVTVGAVAAVVTGGTWVATDVALPEGDSALVAQAEDTLGHVGESAPVHVAVDTQAPVVRLDPPAQPLVGTPTVTVTGTVEEPHLNSVTVAGIEATVAADEAFTVAGVPLAEGANELRAIARDTFGHEATSDPVVFTLDSTPPQLSIASPVDGQTVTSLQAVVSGSVDDANLLDVKVNGVAASVDAAAHTFSIAVSLVDGVNQLTAVATDRVGNAAEKTVTVRVVLDDQPPAITFDLPAGSADVCIGGGAAITLGGGFRDANPASGEGGQPPAVAVEVIDAAGVRRAYSGALNADRSRWSSAADLGAADGMATVVITAHDAYGNSSRLSRSFRVDAAAPVVRLTLDGAPFPGAAAGAASPAGVVPTLFGRAVAAGATVDDGAAAAPPPATLTLDGGPYAAGTPIGAGGTHLLVATVTDCGGHTAAAHALFTVDTTAPALHGTTPAAGARVTAAVGSFSGTSDADLATATVNGQAATVGAGGAFALSPFAWREGRNEVAIELVDRAGNRGTYQVAFEARTVPLSLRILEGGLPITTDAVFLRAVRPEVRPSDSTAQVTATLDGAPFSSGSEVAQSGTYQLTASASDDWGRSAQANATFTVDLTAAPTITVTSPADGAVLPGPTVRVEGTVAGDAPTVSVNGVAATVSGNGWSVAALPLEADVADTVLATARDRRGRAASAGVTVRVVSGDPQVLILEPADGATTSRQAIDVGGVVVGGRARSADGTVSVRSGSRPAITLQLAADGTFRALDLPLASGSNTLTAWVRDSEGRSASAAVTVVADFTPPTLRFLVDGQPLVDGASFAHAITLAVEVADDVALGPPPRIRLNGEPQPGASAPRTEIALSAGGGYLVSAVVADATGNETRGERSFVIGAAGCVLGEVTPAAGSAVASATVSLVGRAGGAASLALRVPQPDGGVEEYAAAVAEGTFLLRDVPLPAVGDNALELVCIDGAGATKSVPHPIRRLAAGEGPTVAIASPAAGALLSTDTVAVAGTASGGVVTVNGLPATMTGSAFHRAAVPLAEGPNPLLARAVDPTGRTAEDRVVVDRDTQAPRLSITRPDHHSQVGIAGSAPATLEVSGLVDLHSEPHLDRVVVSTPQGSVTAIVDAATGLFTAAAVPLDAAAGAAVAQTITATATDRAGHSGAVSVEVTLDAGGPAIVLSAPADATRIGAGGAASLAIAGEAWAAPGAALSVNGIDLDPASLAWEAPGTDGRRHVAFTAAVNVPAVDGAFGLIARATELDGRWAQDRRLLFRDAEHPRVIEMIPADGATGVDANGLLLVLFSEPIRHGSLDGADGLTLTRVSTGQPVAGAKTVAGQAVAFASGVALAAGESYVFRAGAGIADVAGNPLQAPAEARFTAATPRTAEAPALDPLPAVLCAAELLVTGHGSANATIKVRDRDLVFTGFADAAGAFGVTVPVSGSGYRLLRVWALDPVSGATSPESSAVVRVDCRSPSVIEARLNRTTGIVRLVFSETMDRGTVGVGGATAAIRLLDADAAIYQDGTLSWPADGVAEIALAAAADAWWRDRPVRLQVGPPAADAEGNAMAASFETVFFPGGGDLSGGFLSGEAYDDANGRPLAGCEVRLFAAGAALPGTVPTAQEGTPVAGATTDGRGRFVLTGEVPAGRYTLVIGKEGYTRVYRRLSLRPSAGLVAFDSRLTPQATPASELSPVTGGTVSASGASGGAAGLTFTVDAAALPGTAAVSVRLTAVSGQGLPDFLPLGWTPAAATELRIEQASGSAETPQALPESELWTSGTGRLELPLPAWVASGSSFPRGGEIFAVRHEAATGRWMALPRPELLAGSGTAAPRARVDVPGPGTVAIVLPDVDAATRPPALPDTAGDPLVGVERPATVPALAAHLALDPPVVGPTGRSRARVVARSSDGATPWPSGLAVQAFLDEKLVLAGGGDLLEAPFSADLVLYHPELTTAEQDTAAAAAAGAMELAVSPSPRAAQVLLEVGWENIRLVPFPEEVESGPGVGPDGGAVESPDGVVLTIPEGALASRMPVSATLLTAVELAALPAVAGYDTKAAVRVELTGATLARAATLSLPTPAGTPSDSAASPRVILAELVEAPADGRGALARLVSRTSRDGAAPGERVVASPDLAGALPLDGLVREGLYLVLAAHQPLAFVTGFVKGGNGSPIAVSRVTAGELASGDLSAASGRYVVPANAGTSRRLQARHPSLDERGEGTVASLAAGAVAPLDLVVEPVPPRVLSLTPAAAATGQPLATAVTVLFSEALDPATVTSSTLTLELAAGDGGGSGVFVDGRVSLLDGVRVVFAPTRPLPPGRTFRARLAAGVADAGGAIAAGGPLLWSFATSTAIAPGGQVHAEKFHLLLPVDGVAQIYGDPGALPGSLPGQTPWAVSPEIEGPVADPLRETFQGRGDGSFSATVGHPPGFAVTMASRVWVKVFDPTGTLAAELRVGPFTTPDGLGFVAPPGEALTFHSGEGLVVDVPAGAFDVPTLVQVKTLDPSTIGLPTPPGLGLGAYVRVAFDGEAHETLRLHVPAPAAVPSDAQVFIGKPVALPWGKRLQLLSFGGVLERDGQRFLSNDPSLQPEPPARRRMTAGAAANAVRLAGTAVDRTCLQVKREGSNCYLDSLTVEFRLRAAAGFYFEQAAGPRWSLIGGGGLGAHYAGGILAGQEAIFSAIVDTWNFVPPPHDWNGGFVLPVLSQAPLELVRRDVATGWVLGRQVYDPVAASDGLIDVGFLGGGDPARPTLVDARPFQVIRFEAPEDPLEGEVRLTLEVAARVDAQRRVSLASVEDFPLAAGSSVTLFDLAPEADEPPPGGGGAPPPPQPPITGFSEVVCGEGTRWTTEQLAGGPGMLALVGPAGVDPSTLDQLELHFDRPLEDVTGRPTSEVATLLDLGPIEEGCGSSPASGYPKPVTFELAQTERGSRLVVRPASMLAAGHRFRLEIVPAAIVAAGGEGSELAYWDTAPKRFELTTRELPGEPIAGMLEGPALGDTSVARDMLKLGNLLLVASETGDLVAIDASDPMQEQGLRRYAVKNKGPLSATRTLATDGHNRVFYSGLFGPLWAIKALRLEDVLQADATCGEQPDWAQGLPCFEGVTGSVRVAYLPGSQTTASDWLTRGTLPEAIPMELAVLTQDEHGTTLDLARFVTAYSPGDSLASRPADGEGIYTFDVDLLSTYRRWRSGETEPSMPRGIPPAPAVEAWRRNSCSGEKDYDRYQRVTVDNLTTGQSWSLDVENEWPGGSGNGSARLGGLRARLDDRLRVRYNLRALGHLALTGSGITVVDLNRFYRLEQTSQSPAGGQCGRRLGKFEGQQMEVPACAPGSFSRTGIAMTPSVVTHSKTGCNDGDGEAESDEGEGGDSFCRGEGFIDVYSPLQRVGVLHTRSTVEAPGGVQGGDFDAAAEPEGLQLAGLAACIYTIGEHTALLRDVALANDVEWTYRGIQGTLDGVFTPPAEPRKPKRVEGDLLFVSLGSAGIYVFDVSARSVTNSWQSGSALIGRLHVDGHSAVRLQVDPQRGLLFAGGTNYETGKPVIDVWDVSAVNGAPELEGQPTPVATLDAAWSTNQLGVDAAGTGLVYTWDAQKGPKVVPLSRPQFVLSGIYRPEGEKAEGSFAGVQRPTARFVPLGVPLETSLDEEEDDRLENEEKATAAFTLRIALPGSLGPELIAKVQSLRALPGDLQLGKEKVGAAVALPGGPGWPSNEVLVRLRRVGMGSDEPTPPGGLDGEHGPLGTAYQLYESAETVVLLADPRARKGYQRQDADGSGSADEEAQCRRCEWPGYLPDPLDSNDPALGQVKELLAGRFVRVFLFAPEPGATPPEGEDPVDAAAVLATRRAIELFAALKERYPLPAGSAAIAGAADSVPSPLQASLAEPPQSPATWEAGEAGVAVALTGGELLVGATDRAVPGRALAFSLDRTYRSGVLGYGPFGSAGWSGSLFAHLRELPTTGEVEYHDGAGHVWRFYPSTLGEAPEGYEEDPAGSYSVPKGLFLRLQKLSGGPGWRLIGRRHDIARFDALGRLVELSDRHHRGGTSSGDDQGSRIQLRYDPFGQLVEVVDDLGRRYQLEYHDDPRPADDGGDGPRYGLLEKVTDFVGREVDYEYDEERRLTKVRLPEVENEVDAYRNFSYQGDQRPTLEYRYAGSNGQGGVSEDERLRTALLHGKFAKLRLQSYLLPEFLAAAGDVPRARFEYEQDSGRLSEVGFPTPQNDNSSGGSVEWSFTYGSAFPAETATVRAPWDHQVEHRLAKGRVTERREPLRVQVPGEAPSEPTVVVTRFDYAEDGRLLSVEQPDEWRVSQCYADGKGGAGCDSPVGGDGEGDRLARANVVRSLTVAVSEQARGTADYGEIVSVAAYQEDNLVNEITDGEKRRIDLAVPKAAAEDTTSFSAEEVSSRFEYDRYGRTTKSTGGGDGGPVVRVSYGNDERGREGAGLVKRVESGSTVATWRELLRDSADNVERVKTSQGAETRADYDDWDRVVRTVSGAGVDGRLAAVGVPTCALGEGEVTERAFDAAGHVVRERRLQDFLEPGGAGTNCRFVETRYQYNAREQLVAVEQTHLGEPLQLGTVDAAPQLVQAIEYDEHGRVAAERATAVTRPDLVTTYAYDPAGRVESTQTGAEGRRQVGYDARSRVVFATDGDAGTWSGRYDAWGRLFREQQPTGAVVLRRFDRAGNLKRETVYEGDPETRALADVEYDVTSFGAVKRVSQLLVAAGGSAAAQRRVTERDFDHSGRMVEVWSGPSQASDPPGVDRERGRRELLVEYEPIAGRVSAERYGGDGREAPLHAVLYDYDPHSRAPWPDRVTTLESVPGRAELVSTFTTTYRRDAVGRPVEEKRSDGSVLTSVYDRSSGSVIRAFTAAGTQAATAFDGRGLPLEVVRPNGRGSTFYLYDLDGSLVREETHGEAGAPWPTAYAYDTTGRPATVTYADGTVERFTYNLDSTLQTRDTRDGLRLTYGYDAANRLQSVVPALGTGATATLLDAGDKLAHDPLSRPTLLERGRPGTAGLDAALAVRYPSYDLASRPGSEMVGGRGALSWQYDTWDRPTELTLPAGVGRGTGTFAGFSRRYDTLDRLVETSGRGSVGISPTPLGATWAWGGADRLYGVTTKGALGTAARYGYHGGAGPQAPDADAQAEWQLGTLTWGAAEGAGATSAPGKPWGEFGFGWRGHEGAPSDGAKIGRQVLASGANSPQLFAGLGWAWSYDAGVRLDAAASGAGDLLGRLPSPGSGGETYRFGYGKGDELERIIRGASGQIIELEPGIYGRIGKRGGVDFGYDGAGRRLEDDRFVYRWDWRGHLASVTVKPSWPDADGDGKAEVTPWAGHHLRYDYDAVGRLTNRWLHGRLPAGTTDDSLRPFIEKRVFVWEGAGLVAEAAYGNAEETIFRWRKTYVPGPSGLDDAVQVVVEIGDQPDNPYSGSEHTYTLLRDELGTVIAVVAEEESSNPSKPSVPVRYRHTPFGEAHAESGPELLAARFDGDVEAVEVGGATVTQTIADPNAAAAGALGLEWSVGVDPATLPAGMRVERLVSGSGWVQLGGAEVAVGVSAGANGPETRLLMLARAGWLRGSSYRVALTPELRDTLGRSFGRSESLEWRVPEATVGGGAGVFFDKTMVARFESWEAAGDAVGGRFPGGQTAGFQGLWTDPVTGIAYARARWYDARNASWLSEDPAGAVDSPSLYAFVGQQPNMGVDPLGLYDAEARKRFLAQRSRQVGWNQAIAEADQIPDFNDGEMRNREVVAQAGQMASGALALDKIESTLAKPRVQGSLQVVGGAVECGLAMGSGATGFGVPAAVVLAAHCGDQIGTGIRTLATGKTQETLTHRTIRGTAEAAGADPSEADFYATILEVTIVGLAGAAAVQSGPVTITSLNLEAPPTSQSVIDQVVLLRLPARVGARAKTAGLLVGPDGAETPLLSGKSGPSATMPRGTSGFTGLSKWHVEGHAAATMRQGQISNATLYINNPPCLVAPGCNSMLPRMLPENATLRVVGPGGFDQTYVGLPDPPR